MLQTALAWIFAGFIILAGYPWAAYLLGKNPREDDRMLALLVGFAFSLGVLTQIMFWEAILGLSFNFLTITTPYVVLMLIGIVLWWRKKGLIKINLQIIKRPWPLLVVFAIILCISLAILFNAVYWPFSRPDVLGVYGRYGRLMWRYGTLVSFEQDDFFYQTYPVLVPLTYTYAYFASGWQNEYLARLFPALMSLACIPSTFLLARLLDGRLAAWLSVLLLALTPMFGRWASSGYVDLPMAFLYTLSAIFAWRLWQTRHWTDALLAGLMMGLAAWTKNAALLGVALLGIWLLSAWMKQRVSLKLAALALGACAAVAAPWYIRNLAMASMIIPPTVWVDQAQRTLASLLIVFTHPELFGLSGWVIGFGLVCTLVIIVRKKTSLMYLFLSLWIIPFFIAWWLFASYDPRFLLLFLPLLTVLAGIWAARLWYTVPSLWQRRLLLPLAILTIGMALFIVWNSVEFKDELLRNPLMGHEAKRSIVLGEP
jgi:4-amino-4-deoxy-L-arabinose transferase-like glycosyltransferase